MDQLRPFKASFYGVHVRTFPLGCPVYSFPEPAPPAASSHLKYTILSPCQGIPASQRLISKSASFPGAWVTIPEGSIVQGGMWYKPPSEFPVRNNWFCWWTWCCPAGGTGSESVCFNPSKDELLLSQFL